MAPAPVFMRIKRLLNNIWHSKNKL